MFHVYGFRLAETTGKLEARVLHMRRIACTFDTDNDQISNLGNTFKDCIRCCRDSSVGRGLVKLGKLMTLVGFRENSKVW